MQLQLLRHGKAQDAHPQGDEARALVPRGVAQARRAGLLLAAADLAPEVVLTSPLVRARQTADAFCSAANLPGPVIQPWLACGCTPDAILSGLAAFHDFKRVMIVGHEPDFSSFIQSVLGAHDVAIEMKKGAVAGLAIRPPSRRGTLLYLIPPKFAAADEPPAP